MNSNEIYINIDSEEPKKITRSEYVKAFVKEYNVPDMTWEEENGAEGRLGALEVIENLASQVFSGKVQVDRKSEVMKDFADHLAQIEKDFAASKEFDKNQKDAKEKEKEAKKKAKEEEEARKNKLQSIFGTSAVAGFQKANEDFKSELEAMKDSLPDGVTIESSDGGFGIVIEDGATEETIGKALGYFMGLDQNVGFKANLVQFLVGDIANASFSLGLYKSMRDTGLAISEKVRKDLGKKLSPRNVESYARMARTIPAHLRNAEVDATAYLALSDVPRIFPDKLKKNDGESDASFKIRVEEAKKESEAHEARRMEIAENLARGYIEIEIEEGDGKKIVKQDLTSRKDVLPLIEKLKIESGFIEAPDPDAPPKKTASDWFRQYFVCSFAKENFLGVHTKDAVVFQGETEATTQTYTKAELTDLIEEAKNNLVNLLYGDALPALMEGSVKLKKKVTKDGKIVKDDKGEPVWEEYEKNVYPKPF